MTAIASETNSSSTDEQLSPHLSFAPHELRVVEELAELNKRRVALRAFLASPVAMTIEDAERERMIHQATIMDNLAEVLELRVAYFGTKAHESEPEHAVYYTTATCRC